MKIGAFLFAENSFHLAVISSEVERNLSWNRFLQHIVNLNLFQGLSCEINLSRPVRACVPVEGDSFIEIVIIDVPKALLTNLLKYCSLRSELTS